MMGVSIDFWCAVMKLLEKKHGDRLIDQAWLNQFTHGLATIESAYVTLPKPEPKPKRRKAK